MAKVKNRPKNVGATTAEAATAATPSQPGMSDVQESALVVMQPVVTPPPKPGDEIVRQGTVSGKPGQIVSAANRWRENYNPLRGLGMRRAVDLLEMGQRGDYAYLQWAYRFIERRNPTLSGVVSRCEAPLLSFDYSIKKTTMVPTGADRQKLAKALKLKNRSAKIAPKEADGLSPEKFTTIADAQKRTLETAYNAIDNIRQALMHLHMADFRGYAHIQKHRNADGDVYHLECLDQWCVCRDGLNGNWFWNPDSRSTSAPLQFLGVKYCIGNNTLPLTDFIIREVARPINEIGIINTVRRALVEKNYDAFLEIYGIPGGVVEMPPNIPVGKEQEYQDMAQKVAEGGSGAIPNGGKYYANTVPRSQDPFNPRLDCLDAQLVLAATGGKLTMLTEHSSGQQRGNSKVHDETFGEIANGRAQNIAELFQRNFDTEVLNRYHPDEPHLVYFYFGGEEEIDTDGLCTNVLTLKQAGYAADVDWLSEKTGYELSLAPTPAPIPEDNDNPENPKPGKVQNRSLQTTTTTFPGVQDISKEIHDALAPVMVRLKKIAAIDDPDSQRAALEKLATDFPALKNAILADDSPLKRITTGLLKSFTTQ